MSTSITGGCRCGAVRYELTRQPSFRHVCYCRDCQYFTGTDKFFLVGVHRRFFVLSKGKPRCHEVTADNGATIVRGFCGECGSSLLVFPRIDGVLYTPDDDVVGVSAGTLDDPDRFSPEFAVFTSRAPAWATFPEGIELHP